MKTHLSKRILALLLTLVMLLPLCAFSGCEGPSEPLTRYLPVLMYHHLSEDANVSGSVIWAETFADHMRALSEAGYEAVSLDQAEAWVKDGKALPEKPVLITFDDGYTSVYTLACPILRRYGFQAVAFIIGVTVGQDTYKDTGTPIIPHFTMEQAWEMEASGLMSIQSHSYDFHQVKNVDTPPVRHGMKPFEGESEADYAASLRLDCDRMEMVLCRTPDALSYPFGISSDLTDSVLREAGIRITFTTKDTRNLLTRGDPECLWRLGRISADGIGSGSALLEAIEAQISAENNEGSSQTEPAGN